MMGCDQVYQRPSTSQVLVLILFAGSCKQVFTGDIRGPLEALRDRNFTEGFNNFALKLSTFIAKESKDNLIFSPFSIQTLLALIYTGAKGDTARELAKLLTLPKDTESIYVGYSKIIEGVKDPVLKTANRIFLDASASLDEQFQVKAQKYFQAIAESLNFTGDAEGARKHINSWLEEQTNYLIKDVLQPGTIGVSTRMVLVNAVHFKANWAVMFPPAKTGEQMFHVTKTKEVPAQMMRVETDCLYTVNSYLQAQIVELKYAGDHFSMLIFLPQEVDGLSDLEGKLETISISAILESMSRETVEVSLPKFRIQETLDFKNILVSMGLPTMFSSGADFSGMTHENVSVSSVVQKTFIEVNEEGTEAAAATVADIMYYSAHKPPSPKVTVDHPFIFIIIHKTVPIFISRFLQPEH